MLIPNYFPEDPKFYLKAELKNRIERRPFYSMRAFARDLEIGASTLSEFLSGKSGLSPERALLISKKLGLEKKHQEHFVDLIVSNYSTSAEQKAVAKNKVLHRVNDKSSRVSIEEFKYISDWHHLALLEYLDLKGTQFEIKRAAKDLGITKKAAEETLLRLEKLDLIKKVDNQYVVNSESTFTPNDISSEAMKLFHLQLLQKAKTALEKQESLEREFGHVIFSVNDKDIIDLKNDLRKMYLELASKYNSKPDKNQVYCLGVQLHKITSGDSK